MTAFRIMLVLTASLLASACLPVTSTSPVGSTAGFTNDPALGGIWRGEQQKSEGAVYVAFYPQTDGTITVVGIGGPGKSNAGDWGTYSFRTTTLGAYRYIDAQEVSADGKPVDPSEAAKTFPLLYRVNSDGALVIYILDENAAKAAINSGKIAGTVEQGQFGDVTLTASPADLDAFMGSPSGRALFVKPLMILKKVK